MRLVKVSPFNDFNAEYSLEEIIEMYLAEGKTQEEAEKLAPEIKRCLHTDNMRQLRSWFHSNDTDTEEQGAEMVAGEAGEDKPESGLDL